MNQSNSASENKYGIEGFQEAVLSVRQSDRWVDFFKKVAGWKVISRGDVDAKIVAMWNLPTDCKAKEVLIGNPGDSNGFVRLIEFQNIEQTQIRSSAQLWETGAIAAISTRCVNMDESFKQMQKYSWQGFSDPVEWTFGPFNVSEWVSRNDDGVALSITQRLAPPLEGWDTMTKISRVFNSPQIVQDINKATAFYRDVLDFKTVLHHTGVPEQADNVFGLPHEIHTSAEHEITMMHPEGEQKTGTVELIAFNGLSGRDFSTQGVPPNLGVLMLRFPTTKMEELVAHLDHLRIDYTLSKDAPAVEPYGPVTLLALKSPEGAWLEFYQQH